MAKKTSQKQVKHDCRRVAMEEERIILFAIVPF